MGALYCNSSNYIVHPWQPTPVGVQCHGIAISHLAQRPGSAPCLQAAGQGWAIKGCRERCEVREGPAPGVPVTHPAPVHRCRPARRGRGPAGVTRVLQESRVLQLPQGGRRDTGRERGSPRTPGSEGGLRVAPPRLPFPHCPPSRARWVVPCHPQGCTGAGGSWHPGDRSRSPAESSLCCSHFSMVPLCSLLEAS